MEPRITCYAILILQFLALLVATSPTINAQDGAHRNYTRIPGSSPFRYASNPANNLFEIELLGMVPRPVQIVCRFAV